ncbi:IS1634 family transposase [candidate division TA06 bacterium]|uniref:IS1634 family transposase n=1 Tax=candidate division TA06 bacterium TaxID=2250710 RepID=A0A660SM97_UNCT6|nr:MAG: IS1634 family transposase [candidate division TA06 bacterium]
MFIKITPRKKKNKTYYFAALVESFWNKEKGYPDHKVIKNFGMVTKEESERLKLSYSRKIKTFQLIEAVSGKNIIKAGKGYDIGDCYLLSNIWEEWQISKTIDKLASKRFDTNVSEIIKLLVLNRLLFPTSENFISKWYQDLSGIKWVIPLSTKELHYRRLYRYTKELNRIFPEIMKNLFKQLKKKIHSNQNPDHIYYDITSTYFEGKHIAVIAQYGYSRDKRRDKKQVVLAMVVDRYGFPIYAEVLPGNTLDKTTVKDISRKLKTMFKLTNCIIVGDRGMISNDNFKEIIGNNMNYLMALDRSHIKLELKDKTEELLKLKDNEIKIIEKEEKTFLIEFNESRKKEETKTRNRLLKKMGDRLIFLKERFKKGYKNYSKIENIEYWLGKLNEKYPCKRFYKLEYDESKNKLDFKILTDKISDEERYDGFFVLQSSDRNAINSKSIEVYRNLSKVENGFKSLKSDLDVRPIYHQKEEMIKGHIYTCILSYLIENYISYILKTKARINTNVRTILKELSQITLIEKKKDKETIGFEITECSENNKKVLNCFGLNIKKLEADVGKTFHSV